jgi:hypothetical protein
MPTIKTNTPAPHAGETEAPAIPKDGQTPGMGAPPQISDDEAEENTEMPRADSEVPTRDQWDKGQREG